MILKKRHQKRLPSNSFFHKSFLRFEKEQGRRLSKMKSQKTFIKKTVRWEPFLVPFFFEHFFNETINLNSRYFYYDKSSHFYQLVK